MTQQSNGKPAGNIPRGIASGGIPLLSYGFRPFFLAAGLFAPVAMILWLGALIAGWDIGGASYGPANWHAHEMLFGYTTAALSGFLLTTIPNWTGRLPVSGPRLLAIVLLWLAGRVAMAVPDLLGQGVSAVIDGLFLPVILFIAVREIVAGRNWRNLKIAAGLGGLSAINIAAHVAIALGADPSPFFRGAIAVYICLIALIGGRIVPSFTRNWLARAQARHLPAPFDGYDVAAMLVLILATASWTVFADTPLTAILAVLAAVLHVGRLVRWRGFDALAEPMLVALHLGYAFVPVGLAAIALAATGWISMVSALHLLTVGAIGNMTLAVMTRATMGHTGRPIRASGNTIAIFAAVFVAAAIRPFAEMFPDLYFIVLGTSGAAWIAAFLLFCIEFGPMLLGPKLKLAPPQRVNAAPPGAPGPAPAPRDTATPSRN